MGLVVSGLTLPFEAGDQEALRAACRRLGVGRQALLGWRVKRVSLDLRRGRLSRVWSVAVEVDAKAEARLLGLNAPDIRPEARCALPVPLGTHRLAGPPIVIGFGPAGLFAALALAEAGYAPRVLERGPAMEERDARVARFFAGGRLDTGGNIQFGEGGAGAYSDGKLTTRINDPRCELVLDLLRAYGAPESALILSRPHIGTDLLKGIVVAMRRRIVALGGRVDFETRATGLLLENGRLKGVETDRGPVGCTLAVLAVGHSARDTFEALLAQGLELKAKAFSVGVRIEHPQALIDRGIYGEYAGMPQLPPGEYTLSHTVGGRGCYSFCMCPGGQVVAAASEAGGVVTNGMSFHARDGRNANAALCVSVGPGDFEVPGPLGGIAFQRRLEKAAFEAGGRGYAAPVQRLEDFLHGRPSAALGGVTPTYPRGYVTTDLGALLPDFVAEGIRGSVAAFARRVQGFDLPDAVLTGVETRTSSPVRVVRGDDLYSPEAEGLIPCGEGAGYAGGIVSAAVDGLKAAEAIMARYLPPL